MSYFENIRTFVRVYELGSMSAAGRDLRVSPAVTSSRISQLEQHLGVRLFQRTTRSLAPTKQGEAFYDGACHVLESVESAEAKVVDITDSPRGSLSVAAPLGVGRRLIAPQVPAFLEVYPEISIRLRLTDRNFDLTAEGLDLAFFLGQLPDSNLRMRKIADVPRVFCASPEYIAKHGNPLDGSALIREGHECLNLRFPGASEFQWPIVTAKGPVKINVSGRFETDDGDVLTEWALNGHGITMKPVFEVSQYIADGLLVPVAVNTPPEPIQMACLYTHRKRQDPKSRLFMEFIIERIATVVKNTAAQVQLPR